MNAGIVIFSRSGMNYWNGSIKPLTIGNTMKVAMMIHDLTKATIYPIETIEAYPGDYQKCCDIALMQYQQKIYPPIKDMVIPLDNIDTIYLGFPNWWGTMPMPVWTWLNQVDLSTKHIYPFCTNEGSGFGHSITDLSKLCPNAIIHDGLAILGHDIDHSKSRIDAWIERSMHKSN